MREISWGMQWLLRRGHRWMEPRYHRGGDPTELQSGCTPIPLGRTGYMVTCSSRTAVSGSAPCTVHTAATDGVSESEAFMPLTNLSHWDGRLVVLRPGQKRAELACAPDGFFLAYQPVWGAAPLRPSSLPPCLHLGDGRYGLRRDDGSVRPILWVMHGGGLHELMGELFHTRKGHMADAPAHTLAHFPADVLRHDMVWLPGGGSIRQQGKPDVMFPYLPAESVWLRHHGVRTMNYTELTSDYAALMYDSRHFTYYLRPCRDNFPQMPEVASRLVLQAALDRPTSACVPDGRL